MQIILGTYVFISGLFAVYFNWIYANLHGFISWLFFGEVIATFQGLLWPIYLISGYRIF